MSQVHSISNAELRKAMEKLAVAFVKSTGQAGKVLFGNSSTGSLGMVGSEMAMGFAGAKLTKSALKSEAAGMIAMGVFSIAAGCMAIGGAGMEAGATGTAAAENAAVDAAPTVEDAGEASASGQMEATPASTTGKGTMVDMSHMPSKTATTTGTDAPTSVESAEEMVTPSADSTEIRMEERTTSADELSSKESSQEDVDNENAQVEVEDGQQGMTPEEKDIARRKIGERKQKKEAYAKGLMMGQGLAQGTGGITQSQCKSAQAAQQAGAQVMQTSSQTINTSSQIAQKFYGDIQQGITATGQTMDLLN